MDPAILFPALVVLVAVGGIIAVLVHFRKEENRKRLRRVAAWSAVIVASLAGCVLVVALFAQGWEVVGPWLGENCGYVICGMILAYCALVPSGYFAELDEERSAKKAQAEQHANATSPKPPAGPAASVPAGSSPTVVSPPMPRYCPRCRGTGEEEVPCTNCGGAGEYPCSYMTEAKAFFFGRIQRWCEAGRLYGNGGGVNGVDPCPECNGRGFCHCYTCRGRRDVKQRCGKCGGKGEL